MQVLELFVLISLCIVSDVSGQRGSYYTRHNYPNPMVAPTICGRDRVAKSYVCDPDGILGARDMEANKLDNEIKRIINETTCPCSSHSCEHHREGYKIGIALVKKMTFHDDSSDSGGDAYEDEANVRKLRKILHEAQLYAHEIRKRWKMGHCDEDVIIFYSQDDNVVYTATGDVARMKLDDGTVAKVSKEARQTGFYKSPFEGLWMMLLDYRTVFLGSYHLREPNKQPVVSKSFSVLLSGNQASVVMVFVLSLVGVFGIM